MSSTNVGNALVNLQEKTLVLCRTPFQAVMLKAVLKKEGVDTYNLVYFTQDDSEEDRSYYKELTLRAEQAQYIYIKKQRYDIFNHIGLYWKISHRIKNQSYGRVMLSSFDNIALRKLAVRSKKARMVTFDDGTGHINKKSIYVSEELSRRMSLYEWGFGIPNRGEFIRRVCCHYSAYPDFENVMPQKIITYIDLFAESQHYSLEEMPGPVFFVGQPYSEYLSEQEIGALKNFIREREIDFYVKHPRESNPLFTDIPLLPKGGMIAEEAIFIASSGKRPVIYGGFSSVLFNISPTHADKVMLLRKNVAEDEYRAELGEKAGCKIEYI